MRNINKLFLAIAGLAVLSTGCNVEPDDLVTADAKSGGLIVPASANNNYVVGSADPYEVSIKVEQGHTKITSVAVYKLFNTRVLNEETEEYEAKVSNEVLLTEIDITNTATHYVSFEVDFASLRADLEVDGEPLPAVDGELSIGDNWVLRMESTLSDGRKVTSTTNNSVKFTVATRYAGKYKALDASYYRLGVLTYGGADWPQIEIASIDAKTYLMLEYWGPFSGNQLYFQIEPDKTITYPAAWEGVAQTGNGVALATCALNAAEFVANLCAGSNVVVDDDVAGKDQLIMTFGYITPGSGPREFYQQLEKIVE